MEKRPILKENPEQTPDETALAEPGSAADCTPETPDDKNEPDQPDEADETDELSQRVHAIADARWKLYNLAGGAALGLLLAVCLFVLPEIPEFSNWSLILAVVLALLVPRLVENRLKRSIATGRMTMVIVFGATLLIQLVRGFLA